MQVAYYGGKMITSPNGDMVASRSFNEDYAYYDKDQKIFYQSDMGEEGYAHITSIEQIEQFDFASRYIKDFSDDTFVLDATQSSDEKYVFKAEDGSSVTIEIEAGELVSLISENNFVEISKTIQDRFDQLLAECKAHLKSIGLYESFKKELGNSLNFQYVRKTTNIISSENSFTTSSVGSGKIAASTTEWNNGEKRYICHTKSDEYHCIISKDGYITFNQEEKSYPYDIDIAESFKYDILELRGYNQISFNKETNSYKIISSVGPNEPTEIEIKINEDLSVDIIMKGGSCKITSKVEKITKAQFDEMYNKVLAIIENAKENQAGVIME